MHRRCNAARGAAAWHVADYRSGRPQGPAASRSRFAAKAAAPRGPSFSRASQEGRADDVGVGRLTRVGERQAGTMPSISRGSATRRRPGPLIGNPENRRLAGAVVRRVDRREAPRVLVRHRPTRRLHAVGGPGQRVHGCGRAGDKRRRRAQLARNASPPDRRRNAGRPAQVRPSPVPTARRLAAPEAGARAALTSSVAVDDFRELVR